MRRIRDKYIKLVPSLEVYQLQFNYQPSLPVKAKRRKSMMTMTKHQPSPSLKITTRTLTYIGIFLALSNIFTLLENLMVADDPAHVRLYTYDYYEQEDPRFVESSSTTRSFGGQDIDDEREDDRALFLSDIGYNLLGGSNKKKQDSSTTDNAIDNDAPKRGHGNLGYFVMQHENKEELKKQLRGSWGGSSIDVEELEAIRKEVQQRLAQFEEPIKEVEKQNRHFEDEDDDVSTETTEEDNTNTKEEKQPKQTKQIPKVERTKPKDVGLNSIKEEKIDKEEPAEVRIVKQERGLKRQKDFVKVINKQPQAEQLEANFLSFDLGGSGLKLMPLSITDEYDSTVGKGKPVKYKLAKPVAKEINLGRLPGHIQEPRAWIENLILGFSDLDFESMKDWPDFGLADSQTYKLYAGKEHEAIYELTKETNNLDVACEEISKDVPSWAKDIKFWCNKWRSVSEVLGFDDAANFRGIHSDSQAHFEGARAKLQQISGSEEPSSFASLGFGTGHTIFWTNTNDGATNLTAAGAPSVYDNEEIPTPLSMEPVSGIHEILVDIPKSVLEKNLTLNLGKHHKVPIDKPLPLWMILKGGIWSSPDISHDDIREIYKHFFRTQVLDAIDSGKLLKPEAIVLSGGQEEHYQLAQMLSSIMKEKGIKTVAGYQSASHCGIARLSYHDSQVRCEFKGGTVRS